MKFSNVIIIMMLAAIGVSPAYAIFTNTGKITLKILSEDGSPIEGAEVEIGFQYNGTKDTGYREFDAVTDAYGLYTASSATNGHVGWNINRSGYYETRGSYDFNKFTSLRWEPWNPVVKAVLRKIENPVPMYVRDTAGSRLEIPVINKDVGFDLIKFDWVAPYGQGEKADFIFHLRRRYVDRTNYDFNLEVKFSNKYDGIQEYIEDAHQGSIFKLPREAPLYGYVDKISTYITWNPGESPRYSWKEDRHYIFRVRSSADGNAVKAMYGKIIGDIRIGKKREGTAYIEFKYYLNSDYTRNLEFDPKRNLFGNLSSLEQVKEP